MIEEVHALKCNLMALRNELIDFVDGADHIKSSKVAQWANRLYSLYLDARYLADKAEAIQSEQATWLAVAIEKLERKVSDGTYPIEGTAAIKCCIEVLERIATEAKQTADNSEQKQ